MPKASRSHTREWWNWWIYRAVICVKECNYTFFEEYKRLEKLCSDMFGVSGSGVSAYIDHMKFLPDAQSNQIYGWNVDLKALIRLRHYRNQLAHGTPFDELLATQEDIDWLMDFYDRVLRQEDPLALVAKQNQKLREEKDTRQTCNPNYRKPVRTGMFLCVVAIVLLVFALLYLGIIALVYF